MSIKANYIQMKNQQLSLELYILLKRELDDLVKLYEDKVSVLLVY